MEIKNIVKYIVVILLGVMIGLITEAVFTPLEMFVTNYFKQPDFTLRVQHLNSNEPEKERLYLSLYNRNKWTTYEPETIGYRLLIPEELLENKKYRKNTQQGLFYVTVDEFVQSIKINEEIYYSVSDHISTTLSPRAATHFLDIFGQFESGDKITIYYSAITPYGKFPKEFLVDSEGKWTGSFEDLPYTEIIID